MGTLHDALTEAHKAALEDIDGSGEAPPVAKKKLSDQQLAFVSMVDQIFWETGYFPTKEQLEEKGGFPRASINNYLGDSLVRAALVARGVDFDASGSSKALTPKQVVLANMLMNLQDKRSIREKCDELDLTTQQYHAWLRQPAFADYLRKRGETLFANSDHEAYANVLKNLQSGDLQAAKFFMEVRGIYNPRVDINVNIQGLVLQLVEVVSKHVKDPEILSAIAEDVERLELPGG